MRTIIGYLPSPEQTIASLCIEHRSIENQVKRLVNSCDRNNPTKQQLEDLRSYRNQQLQIERDAQQLFNNN